MKQSQPTTSSRRKFQKKKLNPYFIAGAPALQKNGRRSWPMIAILTGLMFVAAGFLYLLGFVPVAPFQKWRLDITTF